MRKDEIAEIARLVHEGKNKATVWCYECGEWGIATVKVVHVASPTKIHNNGEGRTRHQWRLKEILA